MKKLMLISKIRIIAIIVVSFFLLTCEENKIENTPCACGVENPLENIAWIKNEIINSSCAEVVLYELDGVEYIGISTDCPETRDGGSGVYNCDGTFYCGYWHNPGISCLGYFNANATRKVIYKKSN